MDEGCPVKQFEEAARRYERAYRALDDAKDELYSAQVEFSSAADGLEARRQLLQARLSPVTDQS